MLRLLPLLLLTSLLASCATPPETAKAMAEAQARIASQPTVTIKCAQGCEATYTDPRDRAGMRMPTNGWDAMASVAGSVERVVTGAVLPAAGVAIVREVRKAGAGGDTITTTTNTASGDGASTGGDGAWHWEQIGPDSNNSGDTITTDNTSTPTVVTQPAPVIVPAPSPVIVRPEVITP